MSHTYLMNATTNPPLVSGQVSTIEVARDATTVVFHNISVNTDILLSLGVVSPGPTTTPGGEWPYVLPAGHSLSVQVPGTSRTQTAVSTYWQGKIWVLAINQSGQQAVTGKQPSIGNLWITTFAAGEDPGDISASSQASTQIGQQRAIAVPLGAQALIARGTSITAGSDTVLRTDALSAVNLAAALVYVHLYWFTFRATVTGGANQGADVTLFADLMNGASILSSTVLHNAIAFSINAGPALSIDDWQPGFTKWQLISWTPPPNPTGIQWRLHCNGVLNAPQVWWDIGVALDFANAFAPGGVGNFTPAAGIF